MLFYGSMFYYAFFTFTCPNPAVISACVLVMTLTLDPFWLSIRFNSMHIPDLLPIITACTLNMWLMQDMGVALIVGLSSMQIVDHCCSGYGECRQPLPPRLPAIDHPRNIAWAY